MANLMQAALHGASFPKAKEVRASMSKQDLKDFSQMEHESYSYDFRKRNNLKQNGR